MSLSLEVFSSKEVSWTGLLACSLNVTKTKVTCRLKWATQTQWWSCHSNEWCTSLASSRTRMVKHVCLSWEVKLERFQANVSIQIQCFHSIWPPFLTVALLPLGGNQWLPCFAKDLTSQWLWWTIWSTFTVVSWGKVPTVIHIAKCFNSQKLSAKDMTRSPIRGKLWRSKAHRI